MLCVFVVKKFVINFLCVFLEVIFFFYLRVAFKNFLYMFDNTTVSPAVATNTRVSPDMAR